MAVRGFQPLEGERVVRVVRPHPFGRLDHYAPVAALLLVAGLIALAFPPGGAGLPADLDAATGPLALPLFLAIWWLGLAACTAPVALLRGRPWVLVYGVVAAMAGGFAAILGTLPDPSAAEAAGLLPSFTVAAAAGLLTVAEAHRRSPAWVFTTLRLVKVEGLLHPREQGWRLRTLGRVALEPRGPARLAFGDLVVRAPEGEVRVSGVGPLPALRDELELLLHTVPEAAYLGPQRHVADQVQRLLRPGDAPPRR